MNRTQQHNINSFTRFFVVDVVEFYNFVHLLHCIILFQSVSMTYMEFDRSECFCCTLWRLWQMSNGHNGSNTHSSKQQQNGCVRTHWTAVARLVVELFAFTHSIWKFVCIGISEWYHHRSVNFWLLTKICFIRDCYHGIGTCILFIENAV